MVEKIPTLDDMIACVKREIAYRNSCYPKWVKSGKMKPEVADWQINCMKAVLDNLFSQVDKIVKEEQINA